jgi:hypothetical protein
MAKAIRVTAASAGVAGLATGTTSQAERDRIVSLLQNNGQPLCLTAQQISERTSIPLGTVAGDLIVLISPFDPRLRVGTDPSGSSCYEPRPV